MAANDLPEDEKRVVSETSQETEDDTQKLASPLAKRPPATRASLNEQVVFPASQTWASKKTVATKETKRKLATTSRPMPALVYAEQRSEQTEQSEQRSPMQGPLSEPEAALPQTPAPSVLPLRPQRRSLPLLIVAMIALLAILIGGGVGSQWMAASKAVVGQQPYSGNAGPFAVPPLNSAQIDNLRHLAQHMQYKQLASLYVARMPLDEEIGQLIMVEYSDEYYSPNLNYMINNLHAGGVIMYEFQMKTLDQTKHDIGQMQQNAKIPLLVSADEEGGCCVHRLKNIYPPRLGATDIASTGDVNIATREGARVARELLSLGINVNLAPDLDVRLRNGIDQDTRTFGTTVSDVIKYASPYMKALQAGGVIGCIKHFPGLGDASIDAHAGLPIINRTKAQINSVELAPFKYFFQSKDKLEHADMVMPTDLLMPAIDPILPAELSPIFMTDILRKQMGFDGVSLTDALYMKGVVINGKQISMSQAGVMALKAGNDMLLGPTDTAQTEDMIATIKAALKDGTLSKARVDEAATRILALKMQRGLMPAAAPQD